MFLWIKLRLVTLTIFFSENDQISILANCNESLPLSESGSCCSADNPCGLNEGDCDGTVDQCLPGLTCYDDSAVGGGIFHQDATYDTCLGQNQMPGEILLFRFWDSFFDKIWMLMMAHGIYV